MDAMTYIKSALCLLDYMDDEPSNFEANILESLTRQATAGRLPSPKQYRILCEMVEKYLEDAHLLRNLMDHQVTIEREARATFGH